MHIILKNPVFMRTLFFCLLIFAAIGLSGHSALAQNEEPVAVGASEEASGEFEPLSTDFFELFGGDAASISGVLTSLFTLLIALGAIFAILRIAISGITYMLSESFTSKESAKKGLQGSVLGLLLILSVVLILRQINPELLNLAPLDGIAPYSFETQSPAQTGNRFEFSEGSDNDFSTPKDTLNITNTDLRVYEDECRDRQGTFRLNASESHYTVTCPL